MQGLNSLNTQLVVHFKLSSSLSPQTGEEREHMLHVSYANVLGSIICVVICTKQDISHVVSVVSRYMDCLGKIHWK